jgi:restriction system protein
LVKGGLLEPTRRGHFLITQRGRDVDANPPDRIDLAYLRQFPEFHFFRAFRGMDEGAVKGATPPLDAAASMTPDETVLAAYVQIENKLAEELLERLRSGTPAFFEKAVLQVLIAMKCRGSSVVNLDEASIGRGADGDIDGVIDRDALGLDPIHVRTKKYDDGNPVGPGAILDFLAALNMEKASEGVFVTTSSFTAQASDAALKPGKYLTLIDGGQLARLMILYCVGCRVEETLEIKRVNEEFFE